MSESERGFIEQEVLCVPELYVGIRVAEAKQRRRRRVKRRRLTG